VRVIARQIKGCPKECVFVFIFQGRPDVCFPLLSEGLSGKWIRGYSIMHFWTNGYLDCLVSRGLSLLFPFPSVNLHFLGVLELDFGNNPRFTEVRKAFTDALFCRLFFSFAGGSCYGFISILGVNPQLSSTIFGWTGNYYTAIKVLRKPRIEKSLLRTNPNMSPNL
jgi:hypothetical protein